MWGTPGTLWRLWEAWESMRMRCRSASTWPLCSSKCQLTGQCGSFVTGCKMTGLWVSGLPFHPTELQNCWECDCDEGAFYKQREGAAMCSLVSAVMANLYMEFFEELLVVWLWSTYFRSLLRKMWRCSDWFTCVRCGGQPLHGALRRAGPRHCPSEAPPLEEVCWRHLLHFEEGRGRKTPGSPQQCATLHPAHSQGRGRGRGMLPFWTTFSRRRMAPGYHCLQEAHPHQPLPGFPVSPSTPLQEGSSQVPAQQSTRHHQHSGQPTKGRTPPFQGPEMEWWLHPLCRLATPTWGGCPGLTARGGE